MPPRSESVFVKYGYPVSGAVLAVVGVGIGNVFVRKPFWAGLQKHVGYAVIFSSFGYIMDQKMQKHYSERDAMFRHYMELHPEDFVENKKKYRDIFEEWYPHR